MQLTTLALVVILVLIYMYAKQYFNIALLAAVLYWWFVIRASGSALTLTSKQKEIAGEVIGKLKKKRAKSGSTAETPATTAVVA